MAPHRRQVRRAGRKLRSGDAAGGCTALHTFDFGTQRYADRPAGGEPAGTVEEAEAEAATDKFHNVRVLNEDWLAPGGGMPLHGHAEYEIFSIVLEGTLR